MSSPQPPDLNQKLEPATGRYPEGAGSVQESDLRSSAGESLPNRSRGRFGSHRPSDAVQRGGARAAGWALSNLPIMLRVHVVSILLLVRPRLRQTQRSVRPKSSSSPRSALARPKCATPWDVLWTCMGKAYSPDAKLLFSVS